MIDLEEIREYCLSKTGSGESFPFDRDTLVYKLAGKIFAIIPLERLPLQINLKCDPDYALQLRDRYEADILPGYHMNKKHWNTILLEGELEENLCYQLIDHSYQLVRNNLPVKTRRHLLEIENELHD